ncbi:flagellar export protein FliJ [Exilibacterium tricleocarpae]|uniref:Flagellar FliJ protein n=1 Tax=Exilibacterium tricleocarpae TaxID=2591008 RepID=A0A545U3V6_9GAMM|nr:flagellar export protein FliJ [Exilibacterium tricleocarpae]TQV84167.1 flagellar export protein FliJ [Exilibacterium tricleocarpae]
MARSWQRLQIVLTLAEREERTAGSDLEQARRQLCTEEQQLEQLHRYRRDYTARIDDRRQGLRAEALIADRDFLHRLCHIESAQLSTVQRRRRHVEGLQQIWQQKHHYTKAVAQWLERLRRAETRELDQREQRLLDDLVTRTLGRET